MKSERAKRFIDECMAKSSLEISDHAKLRFCTIMTHLAELAEGETENRMRSKAIDAFKSSCKYQDGCGEANRKCDPKQCEDFKLFIQKLNEE